MQLEALNQKFAIDNKVKIVNGKGNLTKVCVETPMASAEIYLHGAHMTSFRQQNQERLWLSPIALFQTDKSIRGGIPICWPWFGPHSTNPNFPQHGFARTSSFTVESIEENSNGEIAIAFLLTSDEKTRMLFPYHFELRVKYQIGEKLGIEIDTRNTDEQAFSLSEAIHSYFKIEDIRQTHLTGLDTTVYIDKLTQQEKRQQGNLSFDGETDYVFSKSNSELLVEEAGKTTLRINQQDGDSTVVWNPWIDKAKTMGDFPDDGYFNMLCVEAANTGDNLIIKPGESHAITQQISFSASTSS